MSVAASLRNNAPEQGPTAAILLGHTIQQFKMPIHSGFRRDTVLVILFVNQLHCRTFQRSAIRLPDYDARKYARFLSCSILRRLTLTRLCGRTDSYTRHHK